MSPTEDAGSRPAGIARPSRFPVDHAGRRAGAPFTDVAQPMPIRRELYEEMAERHEREHREDSRRRRWFWARTACWCWLWAVLGLVPAGWAFHVTDVELGHILLNVAYVVTIAGVLGTIGRAVIVAERRGWL